MVTGRHRLLITWKTLQSWGFAFQFCLTHLNFMPTALESLIPIPCKPEQILNGTLLYVPISSNLPCSQVLSFWHGRVVHPLFPDITNCMNYTTEENFAFTGSCSFICLFFCLAFFEGELIPGMQSSLVFLWHLLNTLRLICKMSVPIWEVQKLSPQSQEEPL